MAQYEQKIDSREFQLSQSGQDPAWSGDPPLDATDIAIRIWDPGALTWRSDSIVVYMIADLVTASGGRVAEETSAFMTAHFDGSWQALVAAKRIQTAILEFRACRPADGLGAAIVVHQPSPKEPAGFSVQSVQRALRQARPGQILLAENVSQRLRDLPGIEFRMVPALASDPDGQSGWMELVFSTPAHLGQVSVDTVAPPQSADLPPMGATMMVQSPFQSVRRGSTEEVGPPVAGTGDFVFKDGTEAPVQTGQDAEQTRGPVQSDNLRSESLHVEPGSGFEAEFDELEPQPFLTRTRIILGAVALVLVGAVIAVLYRPTPVSKVKIAPQQVESSPAETVDKAPPVHSEPPVQTVPPPTAPAEAQVPRIPAKKPTAAAVITPHVPAPPKTTAEKSSRVQKEAEQPEAPVESGGLSQRDIPRLLEWARRDAGNGKYDKARQEFNQVLALQPSNQDAKDGLRRLNLAQSENQ